MNAFVYYRKSGNERVNESKNVREGKRKRERERARAKECVCVFKRERESVCVWARERERLEPFLLATDADILESHFLMD